MVKKSTICEIVGGVAGVAGGAATGVYVADAASKYAEVSDMIRYVADTCGGILGAGVGGVVGVAVGIFVGQLVYNGPRTMNFGKSRTSYDKNEE